MLLGADNFGVETFPSKEPEHFAPVHTYMLAERGISLLEAMWLEDLSKDGVYEFLFIAAPLKLRGATGSPFLSKFREDFKLWGENRYLKR